MILFSLSPWTQLSFWRWINPGSSISVWGLTDCDSALKFRKCFKRAGRSEDDKLAFPRRDFLQQKAGGQKVLPTTDMEPVNNFLHMVLLSGPFVRSSSPPIQLLSLTVLSICALFPPFPFSHLFLSSAFLPFVTWEKGHKIAVAEKLLMQTLSLSLLDGSCMGLDIFLFIQNRCPTRGFSLQHSASPQLLTEGEQGHGGWALVLGKPCSATVNPVVWF